MSNTNLHGNWWTTEIGNKILTKKYLHEGEDFNAFVGRVSGIFTDELRPWIAQALMNGSFLLAGRSLFGAGSKGKFRATMSNCFLAGNKVITKRGFIPIENVIVGDEVATEDGSWQKVNNIMARPYDGDIVHILPDGLEDITCTPNHKMLTDVGWVRADRLYGASDKKVNCHLLAIPKIEPNNNRCYPKVDIAKHYSLRNDSDAFSVINGQAIYKTMGVSPRGVPCWITQGNPVNAEIELTPEFCYFIGRWLGDGSITKRKGKEDASVLQIVFNATTEEAAFQRCKKIGEEVFGIKSSVRWTNQNTIALRFENPIIGSWFEGEFGKGCSGKRVPDVFLGDFNMAIGLLDSDGTVLTHGTINMVLKNYHLIKWLHETLFMNGIPCTPIKEVKRHEDTYSFMVRAGIAKGKVHPYLTRSYYDKRVGKGEAAPKQRDFVRIVDVNIEENVKTTVYNLSVEVNHSYTVNGVVCHNCYIMPSPLDNLEDISRVNGEMMRIFSTGGGAGVNISNLRPNGAKVNNAAKTSTGACSFIHIFNESAKRIGANNRRAAMMIGMNCDHPDIEEFLEVKQNTDQVNSANLSILFTDDFMEAVRDDKPFTLSFHVESTGEKIEKTINAKEFFMKFAEAQHEYGEPGAIFIDAIRGMNYLSGYGDEYQIEITNP